MMAGMERWRTPFSSNRTSWCGSQRARWVSSNFSTVMQYHSRCLRFQGQGSFRVVWFLSSMFIFTEHSLSPMHLFLWSQHSCWPLQGSFDQHLFFLPVDWVLFLWCFTIMRLNSWNMYHNLIYFTQTIKCLRFLGNYFHNNEAYSLDS